MSIFPLSSVPGLAGTLTLTENATNQAVAIEVKDSVLFLPAPQTLAMQASHLRLGDGTQEITLAGSNLNQSLCGGHLELRALTITLRFTKDAFPKWDSTADAIRVSGDAVWTTANLIASGPVALRVGYAHDPGISGRFTFTVANPPLVLPLNLARLDSGEFTLELPSTRPVARLTLAGAVNLTSQGSSQASQLLNSALGRTGNLRPVRGQFTVELALQAGRIPANAPVAGGPALQVNLDWPPSFDIPALSNLPQGLAVDLGLPTLQLPFNAAGPQPGAQWSLGFRDSAIRFPAIGGLSGLRLEGSLLWESDSVNRFTLAPRTGGTFELPEILRILLARFNWGQSPLTLSDIQDAATASLPELEWQEVFASLVPASLPSTAAWDAFETTLRATLEAAAAAFDFEKAFVIAFRGLANAQDAVLERLWKIWFSIAGVADPLAAAPAMLAGLLASAPAACDRALAALFKSAPPGFQPEAIFVPMLAFMGANLGALSLDLWAHTAVAAVSHSPDADLADAANGLVSALYAAPWLQPVWSALAPVELAAINALFSGLNLFGLDVMMTFTILLLAAASRSFVEFLRGREPFASWLSGLGNCFSTPLPELDFGRLVLFLQHMIFPPSGLTEEERRVREERILCAASQQPLFGILLAFLYFPIALLFNESDALNLMQAPVNSESGRKVRTLPKGKYLILSDIHRDTQRDRLPPLELGSIYHFSNNKDLFLEVLNWADSGGFTVLEAGDCEELWFIRDPVYHLTPDPNSNLSGFKKQLQETIESHPEVYAKLRSLHERDRYFRVYGNHDSYLRDSDMLALLKAEMEKPANGAPGKPFDVYDFLIIDDVKKMTESHIWEKIRGAFFEGTNDSISLGNLPLSIGLGMDSRDYEQSCRMLVTHGHQWDFFNCDSNNWLGKLISNAVATPFDRAMDLAIDARGLALSGSPTIDFRDVLANLLIFDNWPGREPAVKFAHSVQHLPNSARILSDGLMYRESVTAILGTKFTALNFQPASGVEITPQQSMQDMQAGRLSLFEYFDRHHSHHICIGHTHNPQSQPYFRLLPFLQEVPVVRDLVTLLDAFFPIKSQYFNSGTSGWMDGVVWGILINGDVPDDPQPHQAKLVFWTHNSREPQFMDWELSMLDPDVKRAIAARFPDFHAPRNLDELWSFLKPVGDLLANFGFDPGSGTEADKLKFTFALPPEAIFPAMDSAAASTSPVVIDVSNINEHDPEQLAATLDKIQSFAMGALMASMGRGLTGSGAGKRDFVLRLPTDGSLRQQVEPLATQMATLPQASASMALTVACLMNHFVKDFPRNLPFFGTGLDRLRPLQRLAISPQPVLTAVLSMLPLMRLADGAGNPLCRPITYSAGFTASEQLEFKLTVGA
jgi:hypothetical protein